MSSLTQYHQDFLVPTLHLVLSVFIIIHRLSHSASPLHLTSPDHLNIQWTELITSDEVRSRTGQPFLSDTVHRHRLSFYGHLNHADPWQDHYRALQACIMGPPVEWRRRTGRPRQTWLRTVETDLRQTNFGLVSAKRCAQDRAAWRQLVTTATSTASP